MRQKGQVKICSFFFVTFCLYLTYNNIMTQKEYITERMKEFSMNIDEFFVGETVIDSDGASCKITNKTINSIEVYIERKNREGINHKQWFDMHKFNDRFKK